MGHLGILVLYSLLATSKLRFKFEKYNLRSRVMTCLRRMVYNEAGVQGLELSSLKGVI